ncbi:cytochrome-c peroxidase [Achromobacter aloeverae]|uniref:Cytochrome-c peroxidase n=1 Tax=Achromobacter aloeverae TaxID=1750518 RepID=A0A4Q1HI58_9BURK|nr:cytochrome c peroxidase [Achromobacter aloeverae]RXN87727.1 cytochrome-c peroxidase [Achromobacter aloeverae]
MPLPLRPSDRPTVSIPAGQLRLRGVLCTLVATVLAIGISSALALWGERSNATAADAQQDVYEKFPEPPRTYDRAYARQRAADMAALGAVLFTDTALSASGKQSCASCHSPQNHYGPPNDLSVQLGGPDMQHAGVRAVPSLMYLQTVPPFSEHFIDSEEEGDNSTDAGPTGGLTWDGRVDRAAAQARIPLLDPQEMANPDIATVVEHVRAGPNADRLRKLFGGHVFDTDEKAFDAITQTLEYYQSQPELFAPYSSKLDAAMRGLARLNDQETRGMRLFAAEDKGNCASCHRFAVPGQLPLFNDFGLIALGLPRNAAIAANRNPSYYDEGLCGPMRKDLADHPEYCGLFRSPTLRNVATRKVFFHNGVFHDLRQVVEWYVTRDTNPEKWYPRKPDGTIEKFDDLPERFHENVNMDPPFGGKPGDKPALSPEEIDDVVAFLGTLTDGYYDPVKQRAAAQNTTAKAAAAGGTAATEGAAASPAPAAGH